MLDHSQSSSVAIPEVRQPTSNRTSDLPFVLELSFLSERVYKDERGEFSIPVIIYGEDLWFFGKETAEVLGYQRVDQAIQDHCKKKFTLTVENYNKILKSSPKLVFNFPNRGRTLIPESDFNLLVLKSETHYAQRVQQWVAEDVLPSIRKSENLNSFNQQQQLPPHEQRVVEIESAARIAKVTFDLFHNVWGIGKSESIIHSSKVAEHATGRSLLALGGVKQSNQTLQSTTGGTSTIQTSIIENTPKTEESVWARQNKGPFTTSQIAKQFGTTATKLNPIMASLGLIYEDETKRKWLMTDKGAEFAFNKAKANWKKKHVNYLFWDGSIVEYLKRNTDGFKND